MFFYEKLEPSVIGCLHLLIDLTEGLFFSELAKHAFSGNQRFCQSLKLKSNKLANEDGSSRLNLTAQYVVLFFRYL